MGSFVNMQDRIADEVRDASTAAASDIEARIQAAILSAIKFYERKRFYFNQDTDTFSTVIGQANYGSAALAAIPNIITIDSMKLTLSDGTSKDDIVPVTYETIDAADDGTQSGDPGYFSYYQQQIRLFPLPSAVRTVTISFVYRLTALSAAGDSNAWTDDAEELIRNRAASEIWDKVLKEEARADRCRIWEQQALDALMSETRLRRGPVKLRTDELAALSRGGPRANINRGY